MSKQQEEINALRRVVVELNSKIDKLEAEVLWYRDFADQVQNYYRIYEQSCEYADEMEIEREKFNEEE